jgi:hypothetical protein
MPASSSENWTFGFDPRRTMKRTISEWRETVTTALTETIDDRIALNNSAVAQ